MVRHLEPLRGILLVRWPRASLKGEYGFVFNVSNFRVRLLGNVQ